MKLEDETYSIEVENDEHEMNFHHSMIVHHHCQHNYCQIFLSMLFSFYIDDFETKFSLESMLNLRHGLIDRDLGHLNIDFYRNVFLIPSLVVV